MTDKLNEVLKKLQKTEESSKKKKKEEDLEDLDDDEEEESEEDEESEKEEAKEEEKPKKEIKPLPKPTPEELANHEVMLLRDDGVFRRESLAVQQEIARLLKKLIDGGEENE